MLSAGWKDVLRPIRDGLGKLLPGKPPPQETPDERRRRRHEDALRGFTYFETFEELDTWAPGQADPSACCSTPLHQRPAFPHEQQARAKVALVHDATGNYHDYESNAGVDLDFENRYSCRYLRYVETFVYFSHKLVCIPPPTWTSALHRSGVKSLGTFLVEPQTPGADRMLQSMRHCDSTGDVTTFCLASRLARLAVVYGFDGWLINIEKPFAPDVWERGKLIAFLNQLRQELEPHGQVVWYDALTVDNRVQYQNGLTEKNVEFAKAAGSMLANYTWTERELDSSASLLAHHFLRPADVYFGIDVWAQNKQRGLRRRTTYPPKGGGGTNTGLAVAKLAEHGFSAAVFAPAWSHEHFPSQGCDVERAMWEGHALPEDLSCSCGERVHHSHEYLAHPICRYAIQHPAGTDTLFYTSFREAFREIDPCADSHMPRPKLHSQLGSQEPLPNPETDGSHGNNNNGPTLRARKGCGGGIEILAQDSEISGQHAASLILYHLNMVADGSLACSVSFRMLSIDPQASSLQLWLTYLHGDVAVPLNEAEPDVLDAFQRVQQVVQCPCAHRLSDCRLIALGFRSTEPLRVVADEETRLLLVREIRIAPDPPTEGDGPVELRNLRLEQQGQADERHWRLKWDWRILGDAAIAAGRDTAGVHPARACGPFASFAVAVMGEALNDALACELVVPKRWWARLDRGSDLHVAVCGFDASGRRLAHVEAVLDTSEASAGDGSSTEERK